MAFPQTAAPTETSFATATTAHAANMPGTVNSGDGLLALCHCHGSPGVPTWTTPSGWTQKFQNNTTGDGNHALFVKVADGTEGGGTVDFVTNVTAFAAIQVYRATDWDGTLAGIEAIDPGVAPNEGFNTSPEPPSLTPPWGALDTLWIAFFGCVDDDATVSAYPTNYTGGVDTVSGGGVNAGATCGSARRELNAASENPAAFTISENENWSATTIAIRPVSSMGDAVIRRRRENVHAF